VHDAESSTVNVSTYQIELNSQCLTFFQPYFGFDLIVKLGSVGSMEAQHMSSNLAASNFPASKGCRSSREKKGGAVNQF
jgi:hypothetical protein